MANNPTNIRLTFPHLGDYGGTIRNLLGMTNCEVITPPPITKRTLELGSKYSPDSVCVPFKYNLGNYLEAIELGANAIFATAGGCRLEYYSEVHQQILKDLGHDIRFFRLNPVNFYGEFHGLNPRLGKLAFINGFSLIVKKIRLIDELGDIKRKRGGFEAKRGSFKSFWSEFLTRLEAVKSHREFRCYARSARKQIASLPYNRPEHPLRVGIIGELYLIMEPAANFQMEDRLASMGVEIHRWITVSSILHHGLTGAGSPREHRRMARPYAHYHIGAHGTESIARVNQMIQQGFDGAIHLKPFGCMPEINALPALHKMCRLFQFPLVSLSFDSHTAETGVQTRLEAFYDMIDAKRKGGFLCVSAT